MWIPDDGSKKYIAYSGALPSRLYRYRSVTPETLDRLINNEIIEESIYLAGLKDLNDPDEGRFRLNFGTSHNDIVRYFREAYTNAFPGTSADQVESQAKAHADELEAANFDAPDRVVNYMRPIFEQLIRVACFTTQPTSYLMWANYAKHLDTTGVSIDGGGICIEYLCDEGWRETTLHPVKYSNTVPEINVVTREEYELVHAMYSKAEEWRCEDEWRITSVIKAMPPFPTNLTANSQIKLEGAVLGIIFGLKTPEATIEAFVSRLRPIRPKLLFKRVVRDSRTFERKLVEL